MLEVLLVTGPLGSGKTTVVNRLLKAELQRGGKVAVLINEFGSVSVDGVLVDAERPELADIANLVNGCACCSLKADVVKVLADWASLPGDRRPDRVVLETTGLADPTDLVDLEEDPALAGIRLAGCLTVISALAPLGHLEQKVLLRRQAGLASLCYVSKADLDPSMALAWESQLRSAFPGHAILRTRMGVAPEGGPDPWSGILPEAPAPAGGPSFAQARALTLRWDHPVDPDALEALFLRPPERGEVLRAKGVCAFQGWPARNDGSDRWAFQLADGRLEISPLPAPASGAPAPLAAVVIGLDLDHASWRQQLRALERPPAGARRKVPLA
ncbi:CobW family GTP-binding protein [Mesoterricola silvestris]|uniref:GTPase n=1 Tax=Mesoterricola silvestris TaxID=2927979 RepID=A0AA48KBK5_9BACT|nr:GTP-binding protein [Mesoterricola silvestris]BDU74422.1 GTPase [Mesoterricola silvestris]